MDIFQELEQLGYIPADHEEKLAIEKMAKAAKGIPDRDDYGSPQDLEEGSLYDYVVQRHKAKKRGLHYDLRVGNRKGMYSWATGGKPTKDKAVLIQQPIHNYSYKDFEGDIPEGYGAGSVKKVRDGQVLITKKDRKAIHGTTANSNPQRYAIIGPDGKRKYLGVRGEPPAFSHIKKPKFRRIPADKLKERLEHMLPGDIAQPKLDGGLVLLHLLNNKPELTSQRISKRTHRHIIHTERFFGNRPTYKIPVKFNKAVLYGEVYGQKGNKVIAPQALAGLLNSNLGNALAMKKEKGIELKTMLFDVAKLPKQDVSNLSYPERRDLIDEVLKNLPKAKFHAPPDEANTPAKAQSLLEQIRKGKHPLTREGIVIHKQHGVAEKLKLTDEHNVYIRNIYEGTGELKGKGAGGFEYSHTPTGPIAGKVGTGMSAEMRKLMWQDPKAYIGLKARVHAQERYKNTQALRAPSLIGIETTS